MVICLERGADLHMAQLVPLPLTVSCFSKKKIGFTFLVPAHPDSPGKRAVKRVCLCVCEYYITYKIYKVPLYRINHECQQNVNRQWSYASLKCSFKFTFKNSGVNAAAATCWQNGAVFVSRVVM